MTKNNIIGFNRSLRRSWLDAAATLSAEVEDAEALRSRLEPIVAQDLEGVEARRKTIDLLINIWWRTQDLAPQFWKFALSWNQTTLVPEDRLWLHYGLSVMYYDFFRRCVVAIGQFGRYEETFTTKMVRRRLTAELGELGSLPRSVARVIASLRDWDMVVAAEDQRYAYRLHSKALTAGESDLELWLLAVALRAHPAQELPFADLLRLPELFPFRFSVNLRQLRDHPCFQVQRQGAGWSMVHLSA